MSCVASVMALTHSSMQASEARGLGPLHRRPERVLFPGRVVNQLVAGDERDLELRAILRDGLARNAGDQRVSAEHGLPYGREIRALGAGGQTLAQEIARHRGGF